MTAPIKLLCIGSAYWPAVKLGGPIFSAHVLHKAMIKQGVSVTVFCTNVGLEGNVPVGERCDVEGVNVFYYEYSKFFEFLGPTGWQFSPQLTEAVRDNMPDYDAVQLSGLWNFPVALGAYYSRKYAKPYVITPHGLLFPFSSRGKTWKKYPYYKLISERDIRGAAAIHFATKMEAEQSSWVGNISDRSVVIPNGNDFSQNYNVKSVDCKDSSFPFLKNKKTILFLGRVNWIKGLDLLIQAMPMLVKEFDSLHLLIVGADDGDGYSAKMKALADSLGLHESVTFAGALSGLDKAAAFVCADLFVLASYSENFANSVVEAMSYGVPVVITDKVGVSADIQANKAGMVVSTNVGSLVSGIRNVLANPELARVAANNGLKMIHDLYNINVVAGKHVSLYERLIGTSTGRRIVAPNE